MAGPFDLITNALGQTNPYDEARAYQARQNAANQAALPNPDGSTTPVPDAPAAAPGPNGGPVGPGLANAPGAKGPTPAQTQPASQQPNSTKTPEDLGSIMLDLQQYNERNQGFNQALGMGVAAFAQPRDRQMVSQMFNVNQSDPTKIGQFLMNTNSQQQGQNRMNALGQLISGPQGDAIAQQLNMGSAAQLRAAFLADPQSVSAMIEKTQTPTPGVANLDQITRYVNNVAATKPGTSQEALTMIKNAMIAGLAGPDAEKAVGDALSYKQRTGKDAPWVAGGVVNQQAYNQYQRDQENLHASVDKAAETHGSVNYALGSMSNRVADIRNNPNLTTLLSKFQGQKAIAQQILDSKTTDPISGVVKSIPLPGGVTLSQGEIELLDNIRQLKGQQYGAALQNLHLTRPAASEIEGINQGLSQIDNLDMTPDAYRQQALDPLNEFVKTGRANSFGASQNLKDIPDDLKPYVDPMYLKGGSRNIEGSGSEDWADSVKPSAADIAKAKTWLAPVSEGGGGKSRAAVESWFRQHGKRPEGF